MQACNVGECGDAARGARGDDCSDHQSNSGHSAVKHSPGARAEDGDKISQGELQVQHREERLVAKSRGIGDIVVGEKEEWIFGCVQLSPMTMKSTDPMHAMPPRTDGDDEHLGKIPRLGRAVGDHVVASNC